jgi:hypothetical protein
MNKAFMLAWTIGISSTILAGYGQKNSNQSLAASRETGTLKLVANGEDFVRQGFVSKDGWKINFDHVYLSMATATAYSTEASFEPEKGDTKNSIKYQEKVEFLDTPKTADLAAGDANAKPIVLAQANVSAGFYNALTWQLNTADTNSPIAGNTIALQGQATKDGQTVNFNLGFNQPAEYVCGEFVGEERQGVVAADTPGQLEATFHFDHIFGDADTPSKDALNQDALGFQPVADLASNGTVELDQTALSSQLSAENYQKLSTAIAGLGHVGEGHCVLSEQ